MNSAWKKRKQFDALAHALALLCLLPACEDGPPAGPDPGSGPGTPQRPPLGMPIQAPAGEWTWIDFPDAVCDDGSSTGIGVSLNGSKNLLVFLTGGGACWDQSTCLVFKTAVQGPFQKAQFDKLRPALPGTILDRSADNPFRDFNLVYVPYCTGDVHGGDAVATYGFAGSERKYYHKGRANFVAFLKRLAATVPSPERVVLTGSSAGGFGTVINYDVFRTYFPTGKAYMLDDSGPAFRGDGIPALLRMGWYKAWNLDQTLGPICPGCADDLSALIPALAARYPGDRGGLLSYTQDKTIRGYFLKQPAEFEMGLYDLAHAVLDPQPNIRYYFKTGENHTFLIAPGKTDSEGVRLFDWITQMVTDDPAWTSVAPPSSQP